MIETVPDPGQLVNVRQRPFVVTEVKRSSLPPDPLHGAVSAVQHLVTLSSVEDDALGEELQVVWQLEPGAHVHEQMALPVPSGFDEPARLDAFLDAVRWGAISSADVRAVQAPFRSGITIEDYQLDPVVRGIRMPRVNLLIADDVGLGKTIEAGLVAQELILRHRVRTVLVVCPSSLQVQWRDQMRDKFGLEFRIVDSALMKELRRRRGLHVNPWTHFPRLITSIDFLKRERPMRLFRDLTPMERTLLQQIGDWAARAGGRPDSKADRLMRWLTETLLPDGRHFARAEGTPLCTTCGRCPRQSRRTVCSRNGRPGTVAPPPLAGGQPCRLPHANALPPPTIGSNSRSS